ncbi:MAG: hypothetical protein EVJ48_07205 [Candidatus Acidulodesulfobacterium acidiphilum]|uniref:Uncharacterized protein n=1 Tax=Candidatus Acidulodesulfobacterium acidiphilum TaxID=2597224 RepID=A0A520XB17_9DELT|nr:MAG: hypothetical protein EVJ48_07205 [Candidatus Acidulodesulfobacterium acidiphilum]
MQQIGIELKVLNLICEIAEEIENNHAEFNERYLHHFFSNKLQNIISPINLYGNISETILHPEWPTYKETSGITCSKYKNSNVGKNGMGGHIDFAIGEYKKPHIGIEFKLSNNWNNDGMVFDFLKLMDKKNPFKTSLSLAIILREKKLSKNGYLHDLVNHYNSSISEAKKRLGTNLCGAERKLYFIITEVETNNNKRYGRRHFIYIKDKFEKIEDGNRLLQSLIQLYSINS